MTEGEALIVVVALDRAASERRASALSAAGLAAKACVVNANDLATLSAPGVRLVLLDVTDRPEEFAALAAALRADERTAAVPMMALVDDGVSVERVAALGPAVLARSGADSAELVAAVHAALAPGRAAGDATRRAWAAEERLRAAVARVATLGAESRTLAHDARVLCGVIVGYAANLRDDIVGSLEPMQREHVAQILHAAEDVASLLDRFAGVVRANADASPARDAPLARGPARRALCDLGELVRSTAHLFENVAAQKDIAVHMAVDDELRAWCDALEMKQVVTNLIVNAIKFTPAGGRVSVSLRSSTGEGRDGRAARKRVVLVVSDTGPGIPRADRERVFERGARLERDRGLPGSGIGLAVVREIVASHGGLVRAEDAPGNGASIVVTLPFDMRTRQRRSVLLVDDADAAQRIVAALSGDGASEGLHLDARRDSVIEALRECSAVVVVPRGAVPLIDDAPISDAVRSAPSSRRGAE